MLSIDPVVTSSGLACPKVKLVDAPSRYAIFLFQEHWLFEQLIK